VATDDDLGHAQVYLHKLCDSHARQGNNAAPTIANIRDIVAEVLAESLAPINQKIEDLNDRVEEVNGKVDRIIRLSIQVLLCH